MPLNLHGKETLAPDREMAPDATEVSWAYLLAPEPREIPEVLRSMMTWFRDINVFVSADICIFFVRRIK